MLHYFALAIAAVMAGQPQLSPQRLVRPELKAIRLSTLFCANHVDTLLKDDASIDKAIAWCRDHDVSHVYIEAFRDNVTATKPNLIHARDRFKQAGFLVSGCITTTQLGKAATGGWSSCCYTDAATVAKLKSVFEYAAGVFDEIMIDDFYFTSCECADCAKAKGDRSWADFRTDMMLRLSKDAVLGPAKAVNPKVRIIIKYPCWHEDFQLRGYDVDRESKLFDKIWVGTETRGGANDATWTAEPQYRAYWLMRWLGGIGGPKCGGGWFDPYGTNPAYYLEQARQTVLGGARELFLFNYGDLTTYDWGKKDVAALKSELPALYALAQAIKGKTPRGISGWKPMNSPALRDTNVHCLLGMAGFPVVADHAFVPNAAGWVFGSQTLHDPNWAIAFKTARASKAPILVSAQFMQRALATSKSSNESINILARAIPLPTNNDANHWRALETMPRAQLDTLRDRATAALGVSLHAPHGVALYLFGSKTAVIESFLDTPSDITFIMKGAKGYRLLPDALSANASRVSGETLETAVPARALIVIERE